MNVSVSKGNGKMGEIPSVSLPSIVTCRKDCGCSTLCYAGKIERLRPTVRNAYKRNYDLLMRSPDVYWREVEAAIMLSRFFRFHVSGDIPDQAYLINMVAVARRNPHCQILCFTKKFALVNEYKFQIGEFPDNLHMIYSGWKDIQMDNPFHFPEAHVKYHDGTTTARSDAQECGGNCAECARVDGGCWSLKPGEQVVFKQH